MCVWVQKWGRLESEIGQFEIRNGPEMSVFGAAVGATIGQFRD